MWLKKVNLFLQIYINWMNFIINLLAPLATMFVMNLAVYKDLRKLWTKHNSFSFNPKKRLSLAASFNHHCNSQRKSSPTQQQLTVNGENGSGRSNSIKSPSPRSFLLTPRTSHAGMEGTTTLHKGKFKSLEKETKQ